MPASRDDLEVAEISAGTMQLQTLDESSRCGAVAALGRDACSQSAVWVARDIVTALPRAYVALITNPGPPSIRSAAGLAGTESDAQAAAAIVRRYAVDALGLVAS